jgi:hypothetical protein
VVTLGTGTSAASGIAVMADGTSYVTGQQVSKLDPNGLLVASFAAGGQAAVRSRSPVVDASGNVYYIGGDSLSGPRGIYALDAEGRPIATFGANGFAGLTSFGGSSPAGDTVIALGRDSAGNLYVAGTRATGQLASLTAMVAKFDRNGRLDTAYGAVGLAAVQVAGFNLAVNAIAVNPGGVVYIGGSASDASGASRGFVASLSPNGQLATGFGNSIWINTACPTSTILALAIDASARVWAGGSCVAGDGAFPAGVVYSIDTTGAVVGGSRADLFGATTAALPSTVVSLAVAASGAIYAGGNATLDSAHCSDAVVAKLDTAGVAIPSFGDAGVAVLNAGTDTLVAMGLDGLGRLYVVDQVSTCLATPIGLGARVFRLGG